MIVQILSIIGILLSTYALYVKARRKNPKYKPVCDISKNVSCSKAMDSKYSTLLILPNAFYGILYYGTVFFYPSRILVSLGLVATIYLAYLSFVKQKNMCVICTGTYIINIALFTAII